MAHIESPLDQSLYDLVMANLAILKQYVPGPVKKAGGTKEGLLTRYQNDPLYSIFGLDSPEYVAATLGGGTITSIHRKLGDIYEQSVATIFAHTLGVAASDLTYSAVIQLRDNRRNALSRRLPPIRHGEGRQAPQES